MSRRRRDDGFLLPPLRRVGRVRRRAARALGDHRDGPPGGGRLAGGRRGRAAGAAHPPRPDLPARGRGRDPGVGARRRAGRPGAATRGRRPTSGGGGLRAGAAARRRRRDRRPRRRRPDRLPVARVLGELLAGVVLGPTAFGNIPYFSSTIVPEASLPLLKLTSNIGLVFFILLVGLETDTDLIRKHAKRVALIALPGMAIPFAISVGLAKFLYDKSTDQSTNFSTFMLFVATVMAVTSLSILSRIISELKLLNTVGRLAASVLILSLLRRSSVPSPLPQGL